MLHSLVWYQQKSNASQPNNNHMIPWLCSTNVPQLRSHCGLDYPVPYKQELLGEYAYEPLSKQTISKSRYGHGINSALILTFAEEYFILTKQDNSSETSKILHVLL